MSCANRHAPVLSLNASRTPTFEILKQPTSRMSHIPTPSESQHSANPDTPPPEYSIHVPNPRLHHGPPSSSSLRSPTNVMSGDYPNRTHSLFSASSGTQFAPPPSFGPTPLNGSQSTLLPYYDPRSPYSIDAAMTRARWRLVGSILWAIVLIVCLFLLGTLRRVQEV